jgi:hypothetical protein
MRDERPLSDLPPPPPVPPPPPPQRPQRSALGWIVLIVAAIVVAAALVNGLRACGGNASARPLPPRPLKATTGEARRAAHKWAGWYEHRGYASAHRIRLCRGSLRHVPRFSPWNGVFAYCFVVQRMTRKTALEVNDEMLVVDLIQRGRRCYVDAWGILDLSEGGVPEHEVRFRVACRGRVGARSLVRGRTV